MKRVPRLLVVSVAAIALFALLGLALSARATRSTTTLTYYFIPGCSTCARTATRLKDVIAPYGARVQLRLVENRSDEGRTAAQQHGFASHGLVLTDDQGRPAMVEADHRVFPDHVTEALGRILGPAPAIAP